MKAVPSRKYLSIIARPENNSGMNEPVNARKIVGPRILVNISLAKITAFP
jgi:hypothetical protein